MPPVYNRITTCRACNAEINDNDYHISLRRNRLFCDENCWKQGQENNFRPPMKDLTDKCTQCDKYIFFHMSNKFMRETEGKYCSPTCQQAAEST